MQAELGLSDSQIIRLVSLQFIIDEVLENKKINELFEYFKKLEEETFQTNYEKTIEKIYEEIPLEKSKSFMNFINNVNNFDQVYSLKIKDEKFKEKVNKHASDAYKNLSGGGMGKKYSFEDDFDINFFNKPSLEEESTFYKLMYILNMNIIYTSAAKRSQVDDYEYPNKDFIKKAQWATQEALDIFGLKPSSHKWAKMLTGVAAVVGVVALMDQLFNSKNDAKAAVKLIDTELKKSAFSWSQIGSSITEGAKKIFSSK